MRDYCREYLDNGIALIPLACYRDKDGKRHVVPNVPKGTAVIDGNGYAPGVALSNYDNFVEYLMAHPQITMMGFYPKFAGFFVLDLDNSPAHANQANGIANFVDLVTRSNLAPKWRTMFQDFPHNFPCHVVTPSGGIHLYFKATYIPDTWKKDTTTAQQNIEIKWNNQVTAAGSIRDDGTYCMVGCLDDAPAITLDLLDVFTKPVPKPVRKFTGRTWNKPLQEPTAQWNKTPDGVIAKALEQYGASNPNDFVWRAAVLFKNAGFDKDTAIQYITDTGIHQGRKDKHDTITAINGIYSKG